MAPKIAAQLNHSGKVAQEDTIAGRLIPVPSIPDKQRSDLMPLLSSAELSTFIKGAGPDGKGPRYEVLTTTQIKVEVQHFAAAAKRAKQAGFDAVEIHAGHGYLISSFLSPAVNKRTDDYGGSTGNRSRLLVEIIQAVRAEVGQHFPILVRLDAKEYRVDNGIVVDDFLITAKLAEQAGADALDISAYGNTSKSIAFTEAPLVHEPGGFIPFARLAKKTVSIPIIAVGRIELQQGEDGLAAGDFDFVAMGRKLLADPDLPNKGPCRHYRSYKALYLLLYLCQPDIHQPTDVLCGECQSGKGVHQRGCHSFNSQPKNRTSRRRRPKWHGSRKAFRRTRAAGTYLGARERLWWYS